MLTDATGSIIDAADNVWTLAPGPDGSLAVYENGAPAGFSTQVEALAYVDHVVSQENSAGGWWSWAGTWNSATSPLGSCGAPGSSDAGGSGGGATGGTGDAPTEPYMLNARAFLDAWGVVYEPGGSGDMSLAAARLHDVGIRRVRAALYLGGTSYLQNWQSLAAAMQASGTVKPKLAFDVLVNAYDQDPSTWAEQAPAILAAAHAGLLGTIEGPNEMNNVYVGGGSHPPGSTADATGDWAGPSGNVYQWAQTIHDWKASLVGDDAAVMADVPLFAPTIASGLQSDYQQMPDLAALTDNPTVHYYSGGGLPPELGFGSDNPGVGYFANVEAWCQAAVNPTQRIVLSEYGATTPPGDAYSVHGQAAYILDQMHDASGVAARQFYIYTLFDPSTGTGGVEGNFGIAESDGTPKPIVQALSVVKDLLSLNLAYDDPANANDTAAFIPAYHRSELTVDGIGAAGFASRVTDAVVYPKSDGSTVISVTNEPMVTDGHGNDVVPATVVATVHLGSAHPWHLYDVLGSSPRTPVAEGNSESLSVPLLGYPMYIVLDKP